MGGKTGNFGVDWTQLFNKKDVQESYGICLEKGSVLKLASRKKTESIYLSPQPSLGCSTN